MSDHDDEVATYLKHCDNAHAMSMQKAETTMGKKNNDENAAYEALENELTQLRKEMWELLKKVTTQSYENTYTQLDDIEKAAVMSMEIRALMKARDIVMERVIIRKRSKEVKGDE